MKIVGLLQLRRETKCEFRLTLVRRLTSVKEISWLNFCFKSDSNYGSVTGTTEDENVPPCTRGDFRGVDNQRPPPTPSLDAFGKEEIFRRRRNEIGLLY